MTRPRTSKNPKINFLMFRSKEDKLRIRHELIAAGVCFVCEERPVAEGLTSRCRECADAKAARAIRRRRRKALALRHLVGSQ